MPNFERNLRQALTYWPKTGTNEFGKPVFDSPVLLPCRWEDINERVIDKHGAEIVAKARIFTAEPMNPEGWVIQGDSSLIMDPLTLADAEEIRQAKAVPDLRNLKTLHTTWL